MPLTILNDPSGITGVRHLEVDYSISLQANIERHLAGGRDAELRINGATVDPLTDPRLDAPPGFDDLVTIALRPRGLDPITWLYIAYAALFVYTFTALRNVRGPGDSASGKDSPNNSLTGQSNIARAYQAIPDVYGLRRVWPDLIQPSTVEYIGNIKYVTEWLCVSRGLGTITDVSYSETPIADITGATYQVFEPVAPLGDFAENGTTTLTDVYEARESDDVNGQELPYTGVFASFTATGVYSHPGSGTQFVITIPDGPHLAQMKSITGGGTVHLTFARAEGAIDGDFALQFYITSGSDVGFYFQAISAGAPQIGTYSVEFTPTGSTTTTIGPFTMSADADQLWWNAIFPRGLKGGITVRAEWWKIDGSGVEIGGTRQSVDYGFGDDSYDQRFFTTKVVPSAGLGRYRIQFTRLTAQVDTTGADIIKLEEVFAVRKYATKTLPGVTVIKVMTRATSDATGFKDRKFNLRFARKVVGLTPLLSIGESRNFGRIMAHIWRLSGNALDELDTDKLAALNAQHGENSPLLRFDGSLDDADMSLGERLQFVADTARCTVWRDGLKWTVTRDQAQAFPSIQFDYRNLAASGESSISYASHLPASNDGVEVEYVDEATQSKKAYVRLNVSTGSPVAGLSRNPKKFKMLGCTTQAQAENRATLEAWRILLQRTFVADTALGDAGVVGLGEMVRWIDPNDFGGDDLQAGEVMSISGTIIETSEPLDFKGAVSGRIMFTGENGARLFPTVQCTPTADGRVQLTEVPAGLYVADAARQCGSRYSFGVGLTLAEMETAGLYVTKEVTPGADRTWSLSLASYSDLMYQGD